MLRIRLYFQLTFLIIIMKKNMQQAKYYTTNKKLHLLTTFTTAFKYLVQAIAYCSV